MQRRTGDVSCYTTSLRRGRQASLGERAATMDTKRTKPNVASSNLVLVEWLDALAQGEWHEPKREDLQCKTVGFVVYEDEQQIELAGTITDGMCNNSITIPKQMIVKRKVIKLEASVSKSKRKKASTVGKGSDTPTISHSNFG